MAKKAIAVDPNSNKIWCVIDVCLGKARFHCHAHEKTLSDSELDDSLADRGNGNFSTSEGPAFPVHMGSPGLGQFQIQFPREGGGTLRNAVTVTPVLPNPVTIVMLLIKS